MYSYSVFPSDRGKLNSPAWINVRKQKREDRRGAIREAGNAWKSATSDDRGDKSHPTKEETKEERKEKRKEKRKEGRSLPLARVASRVCRVGHYSGIT